MKSWLVKSLFFILVVSVFLLNFSFLKAVAFPRIEVHYPRGVVEKYGGEKEWRCECLEMENIPERYRLSVPLGVRLNGYVKNYNLVYYIYFGSSIPDKLCLMQFYILNKIGTAVYVNSHYVSKNGGCCVKIYLTKEGNLETIDFSGCSFNGGKRIFP